MPAHDNLGEQFGISKREQAEMTGRAMGAHIFEGVANIFGGEEGMRRNMQSAAYDKLAEHFGTEGVHGEIMISKSSGSPYYQVRHPSGYTARNYGGGTLNIHDPGGEEVDVVSRTSADSSNPWESGQDIHETLHEHLKYSGAIPEDDEEDHRGRR